MTVTVADGGCSLAEVPSLFVGDVARFDRVNQASTQWLMGMWRLEDGTTAAGLRGGDVGSHLLR